jgi:hypothetical protein
MKLLIRLSILALAAVGAHTLFERLRPRISGATGSGNVVSDTLTPAMRDAASTVRDASTQAVQDVRDASTQAAHDVAGATRQAAGDLVTELEDAVSAPNPPGMAGPTA